MNRYFRYLGVLAVVLALVAGFTLGTSGTMAATAKQGKTYPVMLDNWSIMGPYNSAGTEYAVEDDYLGGQDEYYPQLKPNDIIPRIKTTMSLCAGVTLVKNKIYNSALYKQAYRKKVPKSNLVIHNPNSQHPWWAAVNVNTIYHPGWEFTAQGPAGACITITAQPQYRKKVKHHWVWVAIPHSKNPALTATVNLPDNGGTTTTTTTG